MSPDTQNAPPPYSWTRVRAEKGARRTSTGSRPGSHRTTTTRPASAGRASAQKSASPDAWSPLSETAFSTSEAGVMGDGQEP